MDEGSDAAFRRHFAFLSDLDCRSSRSRALAKGSDDISGASGNFSALFPLYRAAARVPCRTIDLNRYVNAYVRVRDCVRLAKRLIRDDFYASAASLRGSFCGSNEFSLRGIAIGIASEFGVLLCSGAFRNIFGRKRRRLRPAAG